MCILCRKASIISPPLGLHKIGLNVGMFSLASWNREVNWKASLWIICGLISKVVFKSDFTLTVKSLDFFFLNFLVFCFTYELLNSQNIISCSPKLSWKWQSHLWIYELTCSQNLKRKGWKSSYVSVTMFYSFIL